MEVKDWSYEDFPEYTDLPDDACRLETTGDEMGTYYIPDVEYANIDGLALHLQVLIPLSRNDPERPYPCIIYVQGSGWMKQDCHHNVGRIAKLSEKGYVIAIVEYRHSEIAGFPAQIQDARNAIRYMRLHAEEFHAIPDQFFLAGSSSGGHTAVFAALAGSEDHPFFDCNLYPGTTCEVKGVLDYYGCVSLEMEDDFPTLTDRGQPGSMDTLFLSHIAEEDKADIARRASAIYYVTKEKSLPPFFIIHGSKDRIVNTRQSVQFYEKLKSCGQDARFYLLAGADHGGPEYWMPAVVERADAFCRYCLNHSSRRSRRLGAGFWSAC